MPEKEYWKSISENPLTFLVEFPWWRQIIQHDTVSTWLIFLGTWKTSVLCSGLWIYCLYLHGPRMNQLRMSRFRPWRLGQNVPPKRRRTSIGLHRATSYKKQYKSISLPVIEADNIDVIYTTKEAGWGNGRIQREFERATPLGEGGDANSCGTQVILSIYLSIYLWLYSPLLGLGRFSVSWSYTQIVGLLGRGISPSQGLYLHTEQHKHRINTHRHPCLKWDSNLISQCLNERRQFLP
jgi:hypothetical protein